MTGTVLDTWNIVVTKEETITTLIYIQSWCYSVCSISYCKAKLNNTTLSFHDSPTSIGRHINFTFLLNIL